MVQSRQNWQATLWANDEPLVAYGHTLYGLRREVVDQLQRRYNDLREFCDKSIAHHRVDDQRFIEPWRTYVLLNEDRLLGDEHLIAALQHAGYYERIAEGKDVLVPGWYALDYTDVREGKSLPPRFDSLVLAAQHFADNIVLPEKGPDYVDPFAGSDTLPLHHIQTIMRVKGQDRANEAINRGWHLLKLDTEGTEHRMGETKDREAVFVLGHPEPNAR